MRGQHTRPRLDARGDLRGKFASDLHQLFLDAFRAIAYWWEREGKLGAGLQCGGVRVGVGQRQD